MEHFDAILDRAIERKGGAKKLESLLVTPLSTDQLRRQPDSYFLAEMTKKIFQAGFVWKVVENKWPGFERVFWGFEPQKLALASDEQMQRMASDPEIIRNLTKVMSVRDNAYFVKQISQQHHGFGAFIAEWPSSDIVGLWQLLKKQASRLGGNSGAYFLRAAGKDTFLLTPDVCAYLQGQGIIDKTPSTQKALQAVQSAFNQWHQQSGRPLCQISKIVASSLGENVL